MVTSSTNQLISGGAAPGSTVKKKKTTAPVVNPAATSAALGVTPLQRKQPWQVRPGDVATMGKATNPKVGKNTTSVVQTLSPSQQAIMNKALPQVGAYAREDLTINPNKTLVAPFNAAQQTGQADVMAAAKGSMTDLANQGAETNKFMMDPAALTAAGNPMEQAAIDAAVRPISQQLTDVTLPQLRSGAAVGGQYGSSRQAIAEGLASRGASQATGDTAAKIAESAYQSNLDAMTKALGLLPSTQAAQTAPGVAESGVGDVRQGQQQDVINANLQRDFYNKSIPLTKAQNLVGMATGTPGAGTATSASPSGSIWDAILGGAATGASLGSAISPGLGTGIGGVGGAGVGAALWALDH